MTRKGSGWSRPGLRAIAGGKADLPEADGVNLMSTEPGRAGDSGNDDPRTDVYLLDGGTWLYLPAWATNSSGTPVPVESSVERVRAAALADFQRDFAALSSEYVAGLRETEARSMAEALRHSRRGTMRTAREMNLAAVVADLKVQHWLDVEASLGALRLANVSFAATGAVADGASPEDQRGDV